MAHTEMEDGEIKFLGLKFERSVYREAGYETWQIEVCFDEGSHMCDILKDRTGSGDPYWSMCWPGWLEDSGTCIGWDGKGERDKVWDELKTLAEVFEQREGHIKEHDGHPTFGVD